MVPLWPPSPGAVVVRAAITQATWTGDRTSMLAKHEHLARVAQAAGAQIICFQELFHGPDADVARGLTVSRPGEPADGPIVRRFAALAAELGLVMVLPIHEREMPGVDYDTAVVVDADGSILGSYRRQHVLSAEGSSDTSAADPDSFRPGNLGFPVFRTAVGSIGICIGDDRHFPESWRALGLGGAHIVFNPCAAGPGPTDRRWEIEQPAAAAANGYFVAAPNWVGVVGTTGDDPSSFHGSSQFVDPSGHLMGEYGATDADEVMIRDFDLAMVDRVRDERQLYRARRPDAYVSISRP